MAFRKSVVLLIALAAFSAVLPAACRRKADRPAVRDEASRGGQRKDALVLQVGGRGYMLSEFDDYVRRTVGAQEEPLSPTALSSLFNRFVEDRLLLNKARSLTIDVSEQELTDYLAKVKASGEPGEETPLDDADMGRLRDKLLVDKYTYELVKDIRVADDEVKAYYAEHKSEFLQSERFEVSQILTASEEEAVDILSRVKGRPLQEFEQAAREKSIGVEAERGGRMGVFSRGQLPFEIERVVLSLELGQISRVVESSYGYHIFLLTRRIEPELVPVEKAASGIRLRLLDRKISLALAAHLEEIKKSLDWKTLSQNLPFKYQRNMP